MNEALLSSKNTSWCTPIAFFNELNSEFNFELDPAATDKSAKCANYYTPADDGLTKDWGGRSVFCNPPYGKAISDWVRKGYEESQKPGTVVVMLIPARTDTSYYHNYILHGKADEIRFLRGRLKFTDEDGNTKDAAPFPSAVIVWRSQDMKRTLREDVLDLLAHEQLTANEITEKLNECGHKTTRSDVSPILTKAQTAGTIQSAGKRMCSITGKLAIVWEKKANES